VGKTHDNKIGVELRGGITCGGLNRHFVCSAYDQRYALRECAQRAKSEVKSARPKKQ
jgi:hypothetical protein